MTDKSVVIEQTNLAFDFLQKLYLEVSYLVKQIEGTLSEEERFVIGKPAGYGVSTRSSIGLEAANVRLWLMRKFAIFFVPEDKTAIERGQTVTRIDGTLKVLYLRFLLHDKSVTEPTVYGGVLHSIEAKPSAKWIVKFENVMGHISYNDEKVFKNPESIDFEDSYVRFQGELIGRNLFEINDSKAITDRLLKPALELYRKQM